MSSPTDSPGIVVQHEVQIATLTLVNPSRRNAMTRQMWRDLQRLPSLLKEDTRCLVIRGEGGHFCAGGDISEYPSFRFDEASLAQFHEKEVAPALEGLLALDVPIVAQIAGNCIGGGLEIACCADIRIAGRSALFGAPIAKLGMPMAPRELAIVLQSAGEVTLREMLLEANLLSADEMKARGWLTRVVSDAQLDDEVQVAAQRIAGLSPLAARLNKQAFRQILSQIYKRNQQSAGEYSSSIAINSIVNGLSAYAHAPYAYAPSREHREGIEAFLEKRSPKF